MNPMQQIAIERGWDDAQMAAYLGLPRTTVRSWLSGIREPGAAALRLLEVLQTLERMEAVQHRSNQNDL